MRKRNKNRTKRNNIQKIKGGWEIIRYDNINDEFIKKSIIHWVTIQN